MHRILLLAFSTFMLHACSTDAPSSSHQDPEIVILPTETVDPFSYSRPQLARVNHLALDLEVDFDQHILSGEASWTISHDHAEEIILDVRDLEILEVLLGADRVSATYALDDPDPVFGQALHIQLTPETDMITIRYRTTPKSTALQWLDPEQTESGVTPFLYTQSQAIHARTWIPCQDSPGVKFTYSARIRTPRQLMAVMSAENPTNKNSSGSYTFRMNQPIPSYLMALAVGDLDFRPVGPRTGIYASPEVMEAAVYEFGELENMLTTIESRFGPYLWDRYDILIMPPSFPMGGMENPRLSFITPSVIAGDRSLTDLIIHEMTHSWAGNLVTCATWNDIWLNEGIDVYLQRRVSRILYGDDYAEMSAELGYNSLQETIASLGENNPDTRLKLDMAGRNPEDGMSGIAYQKGYSFLDAMGRATSPTKVDLLMNAWFRRFDFESVATADFLAFAREKLIDTSRVRFDMDQWVYGTGLPASAYHPDAQGFRFVERQIDAFKASGSIADLDTTEWLPMQWLYFVQHLPDQTDYQALDQAFHFSASGNSEILCAWFEQCLRNGYIDPIMDPLSAFLRRIGRTKYVKVLYEAMIENKRLDNAWSIYQQARPRYHALTRKSVDELFSAAGKRIS